MIDLHPVVAGLTALGAGAAGWFVPQLVARLPEPPNPDKDKVAYPALAALPGLAWRSALASALAGAVVGGALGTSWTLLFLLPLCPVGVALAYVDWRVRLLPTAIIGPTYLALLPLLVAAALLSGEPRYLLGALLGWVLYGGLYWLLWRFTPGMGYGDVRLSGVLGLVLGFLGMPALLSGLYAGFVLGVLAWLPMRLLKITTSRTYPFGPFMLLGVLVGVVWSQLGA